MEYRFILRITKYLFTENTTKLGVMTFAYNLHTQEPKNILKNKKRNDTVFESARKQKKKKVCLVAKLQGSLCLWNYWQPDFYSGFSVVRYSVATVALRTRDDVTHHQN